MQILQNVVQMGQIPKLALRRCLRGLTCLNYWLEIDLMDWLMMYFEIQAVYFLEFAIRLKKLL